MKRAAVALSLLAVLGSGCGSSGSGTAGPAQRQRTASSAGGQPAVTLALHGGGKDSLSACGTGHHYRTYRSGAPVVYSGAVRPIPSGTWKLKLKFKLCRGGTFVEFAKLPVVRDRHTGTFGGRFPAPAAGAYELRAELYVRGIRIARSAKRHLATH